MDQSNTISEITRRAIFDDITLSDQHWSGRLSETDFLSRLYDLNELESYDSRFSTAAGDITMHREHFIDWDDDWVFHDDRFNLLNSPDEEFLDFICETVHPIVRPDEEDARNLVEKYNNHLRKDDWELYEKDYISERPVWDARSTATRVEVFSEPTGWEKVDRQLEKARSHLQQAQTEEEYQAVGLLCREALISLAIQVFDPESHEILDDKEPSKTDARRKLEAFLSSELSGGTNEEARGHAKKSLRLALALQHKRSADFQTAALCIEATASVVNIAAIISGRRGHEPS